MTHLLEYIETPSTKLWTESFLRDQPQASVVFTGGSGEYRTVSMHETEKLARWLNSLGHGFVAFDKQGCGESSGSWSSVTMDILVADFAALACYVKNRHQTPLILMGHSQGSRLALEVAATIGDVVAALILRVCSSPYLEERLHYQLTRFGTEAGEQDWEKWKAEMEEIKRTVGQQGTVEGFCLNYPRTYWLSWLNRKPSSEFIDKLNIPIFALNAEDDEFTPDFAYGSIHEKLKAHFHPKSLANADKVGGHGLRKPKESIGEAEADKDIEAWLKELWD